MEYSHVISHRCAFCGGRTPSSNINVHQYTRRIFGANDWPTCANYALHHASSDNAREYPEAPVVENLYMDDYLISVKFLERVLLRTKLTQFMLTKFLSIVLDLADRIDKSAAQSTEPKSRFHPMRNQGSCLDSSGITTTILRIYLWSRLLTAPSQKINTALFLESCVEGRQPNRSCCRVHCRCSFNRERPLACQGTKLVCRVTQRHSR